MQKSADQGNSWAQNLLGYMYQHGKGVMADGFKAVESFKKAAAQGDVVMENLGDLYLNGDGVTEDDAEAFNGDKKAAEADDNEAEISWAVLYLTGKGTTADPAEGMKWLLKISVADDPSAWASLATFIATAMASRPTTPRRATITPGRPTVVTPIANTGWGRWRKTPWACPRTMSARWLGI